MTLAEITLTAVVLALLAFVAWRERTHDRLTQEREQAWRLERTGLLERIQHPEIVAPTDDSPVGVQYVPFEDDEALEEALEGAGLNGGS